MPRRAEQCPFDSGGVSHYDVTKEGENVSVAANEQRRTVNVELQIGLLSRLDEEARRLGISRSELLNCLIREILEEEDPEDALLADIAERADLDPENQERVPFEQVIAESHATQ
ncbi:MAG: ribbon-helix-helix protein, CopG family [Armatimonadetes bacterium]|nr:ribbon-helix-helix protein, CopG family [Armatimonadota bacterium]